MSHIYLKHTKKIITYSECEFDHAPNILSGNPISYT